MSLGIRWNSISFFYTQSAWNCTHMLEYQSPPRPHINMQISINGACGCISPLPDYRMETSNNMSPKGKKRNFPVQVGDTTLAVKREGRGVNGGLCEVVNAKKKKKRGQTGVMVDVKWRSGAHHQSVAPQVGERRGLTHPFWG